MTPSDIISSDKEGKRNAPGRHVGRSPQISGMYSSVCMYILIYIVNFDCKLLIMISNHRDTEAVEYVLRGEREIYI
jgi:hypothetical protein